MKFINIAEEQMMSATKALQKYRDFFNEYFLFEERKEFEEDIQNIIENTDFNITRSNIALLTEKLQSLADCSMPFTISIHPHFISGVIDLSSISI
jgi:hypothetical protein